MKIAHNPETGEYLGLNGDRWEPLRVATNDAGEKMYLGPNGWEPFGAGNAVTSSLKAGQDTDNSSWFVQPEKPISPEGAPLLARFSIGSASDDETKLARAKDYLGDSVRQEANGDLSFISPKTGQRILVNPEGLDIGDIAGSTREIASTGAGILGAIAGGISGGGLGSLATGSAAGSASAAAVGQGVDALAAWLARREAEQRGSTPSPMQEPTDALKDFALETALGTVGGVTLGGAGRAASKALSPMKQDIVQAWNNLGQKVPSIAAGTDSKTAALYEKALGGFWGSAGTMQRAREAGAESLQAALDRVAQKASNGMPAATPFELGQAMKEAAERSKAAFQAEGKRRFDDIDALWGQNKGNLNNTMAAIREMSSKLSPNVAIEAENQLYKNIAPEMSDHGIRQLNASSIKNAQTRVRNLLKDPQTINTSGQQEGQLKVLKNALGEDYRAALADPKAIAEYDAASKWYAEQKELRKFLESSLGGGDLQKIGESLLSPNLTPDKVAAMKKLLDPKSFGAMRGSIIRNLGRPLASSGLPEGQASAARVSRALGTGKGAYSPETQQLLFGDDLADVKVISKALADIDRAANSSQTAQTHEGMLAIRNLGKGLQLFATGSGAASLNPIPGAIALGVPYGLSRLSTSPTVINWLSKPNSAATEAILRELLPQAGVAAGTALGR